MGVIALPNPASVALHEKFGMERVGLFKGIGIKFGQRIDVGYWQRSMA
jgi:phosphinothricin acetyltransferase